jgi:hypothetical protein
MRNGVNGEVLVGGEEGAVRGADIQGEANR